MANNNSRNADVELSSNLNLLEQVKASILRIQEGTSNYSRQLREVNKELKNSESAYSKIQARLNSYNKETINVKEVENELFKSRQQTNLLEQNQSRVLAKAKQLKKDGLILSQEELKSNQERLATLVTANGNIKKGKAEEFDRLNTLIESTKNMNLALKASREQLALSRENQKIVGEEAAKEKALNKQLGVRSQIMQSIAKKLGVEQEVRGELIRKAREGMVYDEKTGEVTGKRIKAINLGIGAIGRALGKNLSIASTGTKILGGIGLVAQGVKLAADNIGKAFSKFGSTIKGLSPDASSFFANITAPVQELVGDIPIIGGLLSGTISGFSGVLDLIIGVDNKIVKMGRSLGMGATESRKLNEEFAEFAKNSEKSYITSDRLFKSFSDIASTNEINNRLSKEILETNIELADYAGLEAQTRAELANTAMISGKTMKETTSAILGQVRALEDATGLQFNQQKILKEITTLGGRLGLEFSKYPEKITQALLKTKAMGLELKDLNSMADSFLDFESSISKEFEAQLLTGKDINLMKARELFLNNDLAGAAAEITRQVGTEVEFRKLNRIAQDALAASMGMTADQMADMLKKQVLYSKFGVTDQKSLLKKIDLMKKVNEEQKAITLAGGAEEYQNLVNLSTQEKLMTSFEKIKNSLVDFLTKNNILEKLQGYIEYLSSPKNIAKVVNTVSDWVGSFMGWMGTTMSAILKGIGWIGNFFTVGRSGDLFQDQMDIAAIEVESFGKKLKDTLQKKYTEENFKQKQEKEENVDDAVIFPSNNLRINKDPQDYTIFTKNPSALFQTPQIDVNKLATAITTALNQRPVNVSLNANLSMDGQPTAKVVVSNIKNSIITSFDRQSGPMSQNS